MARSDTPQLIVPITDADHIRGELTAPCTLLEYGDFECPFCGRAFPIIQQLEREFASQLRLVFRHFPLFNIHPRAENAAEAAEAAGAQGKFWEMHDVLFEYQHALEFDDLVGLAARLDLDTDRFQSDLIARQYLPVVRESREGGVRAGVSRTPTFFINGRYFGGSHELEALRDAVTEAIRSVR